MYYLFNIPMDDLIELNNITLFEWFVFIGISFAAFIAIGGIVHAFQLENVIIISIILYSEVAFGTLFQFILLNDTTNFDTFGLWIGIILVILSTSTIMYRKENENKNKPESEKKIMKKHAVDLLGHDVDIKNGKETTHLIQNGKENDYKKESYGSVDKIQH